MNLAVVLTIFATISGVSGDAVPWSSPCKEEVNSAFDFCDETLSIEDRVKDVLSRLTLEEKLSPYDRQNSEGDDIGVLLSNAGRRVDSLKLPAYQWWSEALHGVAMSPGVTFDGPINSATSFPQPLHTSQSFNRSLFSELGKSISTEARAMSNIDQAGLTYWTPNLNLFRDPRWGRGQETPGEDPYLTSQYVEYYVPALEGKAEGASDHLKISACCKHYAAYSFEQVGDLSRHQFDANVSDIDFADTYLPAFESCASKDKAAASSIMCSYNAINGVPSCANSYILSDIARDKWGFEGYITSDCGAVDDVYSPSWGGHDYAPDPSTAVLDVLGASMDSDCGNFLKEHLEHAVNDGTVSMDLVDRALTNLFTVQFRLGMFDKETPYDSLDHSSVDTPEHRELALDAARQGMVLLKNKNQALPLSPNRKVGVIGPHYNASTDLQGNYQGVAPFLSTPLSAISSRAQVSSIDGCDINSTDTSRIAAAEKIVENVDTVVLVVGINESIESEGLDRSSIGLPGVQTQLIEAVLTQASIYNKPVCIVYIGGGASDLSAYANDDRVSAIISAGYSGQSGGEALAEVIFGEIVPSGRLTQTFHSNAFVDETDFLSMDFRPSSRTKGRTYRFYRGENVVYEFGTGLSYTSFDYEVVSVEDLKVALKVTNVGKVPAAHSILAFVLSQDDTDTINPMKKLRAFERVWVEAGETITLDFEFTSEDFALADKDGSWISAQGVWEVQFEDGAGNMVSAKLELS